MLLESTTVAVEEFERRSGWSLKREGACKGDVCISLPDGYSDPLDVQSLAAQMALPLVAEVEHGLWALGPDSVGDKTLVTAQAPDLRLNDLDGREFRLSSLLGQKVLLVAWAPY